MLIADYNRDGKIDPVDYDRMAKGEAFTVWLNDDNDAAGAEEDEGKGDTNSDLHDVPGGNEEKDCEDSEVNGRCDLLDFFPVLVDVSLADDWDKMTWKLSSTSVNVVFTQLEALNAGDFHTKEVKALDDETPLYKAPVEQLAGDGGKEEITLPGGLPQGRPGRHPGRRRRARRQGADASRHEGRRRHRRGDAEAPRQECGGHVRVDEPA